MHVDINNEINKLYCKYNKEIHNKNLDKITLPQINLFDKILDKTKLSDIKKKNIRLIVSNLSKKQFFLLIKKYNYYNASFNVKLKKFSVRVCEKIIINNSYFQIGYQKNYKGLTNLIFFIKFYNFMMLDYDNITYNNLITNLEKLKNIYNFIIFKTDNGYHVFVMSHLINYNSIFYMNLMKDLGCDVKYIYFTYTNGYKCRLSPKKNYKNIINHKYISFYGTGKINNQCLYYLNIMNKISNLFLPNFIPKIRIS